MAVLPPFREEVLFMSLPNIPNITPDISLTQCEAINLLFSSIAMEEIGLSHILNAEGEKLQQFLKTDPQELNDYLEINKSVNALLRTIVKSQMMLHFKLEDTILLAQEACGGKCPAPHPPNPCRTKTKCKTCYNRKMECTECRKQCEE